MRALTMIEQRTESVDDCIEEFLTESIENFFPKIFFFFFFSPNMLVTCV